jgi:hypothetical protein
VSIALVFPTPCRTKVESSGFGGWISDPVLFSHSFAAVAPGGAAQGRSERENAGGRRKPSTTGYRAEGFPVRDAFASAAALRQHGAADRGAGSGERVSGGDRNGEIRRPRR